MCAGFSFVCYWKVDALYVCMYIDIIYLINFTGVDNL